MRMLLLFLGLWVVLHAGACGDDEEDACSAGTYETHCEEDVLYYCDYSFAAGHQLSTDDCAGNQSVCVEAKGTAACVAPSRTPCASALQEVCSSDGDVLNCNTDVDYLQVETRCSDDPERVCVEANDSAGCVLSERLPCDGDGCSDEGTLLLCSKDVGFLGSRHTCADGLTCIENDALNDARCVVATPCDADTGQVCSDEGAFVLDCNVEFGYLEVSADCLSSGSRCVAAGGSADCQ